MLLLFEKYIRPCIWSRNSWKTGEKHTKYYKNALVALKKEKEEVTTVHRDQCKFVWALFYVIRGQWVRTWFYFLRANIINFLKIVNIRECVRVCVCVRLLLNMISDEIGESACNHQNDHLKINFVFVRLLNRKMINKFRIIHIFLELYTQIYIYFQFLDPRFECSWYNASLYTNGRQCIH